MARKSNKKPAPSPLGQVVKTLEKQATSPAGMTAIRYFAPRVLPIVTPILLSLCSFLGIIPGCKSTPDSSGKLPEITQKLRPGQPSTEVDTPVANNTAKPPVQGQLTAGPAPSPGFTSDQIVFMFWNCENFFDDHDDNRKGAGDKEYDPWFAKNPQILRQKLDKLTEAILSVNNGRGPDILAICEVESIRAAQLLQVSLNAKLPDPNLHYRNLMMKEVGVGRHISPAVLTRFAVDPGKTKAIGSRKRILETHIQAGGRDLVVIASHWTSRLQDGSESRMEYAQSIYGAVNAIYHSNTKADVIVCGDLNDDPNDVSLVQGMHTTANPSEALGSINQLRMFNLMGGWTPAHGGSMFYQGWHQFDQIIVSPGMLDRAGWSCDPQSVRVINSLARPGDPNRHPWKFGGEKDSGPRGYSDHFPVAVRLVVN